MMRLVLPLAVLAGPALADAALTLPPGCEATLTVQERGCSVRVVMTCESDGPGVRRDLVFEQEGMTFMSTTDPEGQWLTSSFLASGGSEVLEDSPADRISMSNMLATGEDPYDFVMLSEEYGDTRYIGSDRLTGGQAVIDGVIMPYGEWGYVAYDAAGQEIFRSEGDEYVATGWRIHLTGKSRTTYPDGSVEQLDYTPVDFILPGEDGFLSPVPLYGCEEAASR
ncbi:hypothetical protein [Roseisalinus antarcticus]|uniref:MORN repeat variant n=1 Tax=Roseisalinus antarcticus TaxID=254357 RepID=A0A1Y5TY68_9RHOB|nr:hypothetical protein [Roseisalinus antarcticus]SLN70971.1 hypothetical protein ROA7023_03490 [Roseisalinus antarcticus]